ncbi:hypothetical protein P3L10_025981 [Capsicum annuum]
MATQALISSSSITSSAEAARQILGARHFQPIKKASFVVRATATPPVKRMARGSSLELGGYCPSLLFSI